MEKATQLRNRLIDHTVNIIILTKKIPNTVENGIFAKQIIRSSSSMGANYSEAIFAHSRVEFVHIVNICRREASETLYWLDLIKRVNPKLQTEINSLITETESLLKIFVSSVKTAKSKISK